VKGPSTRTTTTGKGTGTVVGIPRDGFHKSPVGLGNGLSIKESWRESDFDIKQSCPITGGRARKFRPLFVAAKADSVPRNTTVADFVPL